MGWASNSPFTLQQRRAAENRPACGSGVRTHGYNTGIHVFALFLILVLSTFACSFPIIVRRFPKLPIPNHALFISRHFGTGVLIATAFVHLLPTAFVSLTDPCLPYFWTDGYPAMAGFVAMISVMAVVTIEMIFAIRGAGHSHHVDLEHLRGNQQSHHSTRPDTLRSDSFKRFRQLPLGEQEEEDSVGLLATTELQSPGASNSARLSVIHDKPLPRTPPPENDDSDLDLHELDPFEDDPQPANGSVRVKPYRHRVQRSDAPHVSFAEPVSDAAAAASAANEQRMILQCLLLEAGILFHSVFIGMALSVSTGSAFVVLLVAISFHQTFEGLALGSRIAAIASFSTSSYKPWLMSLMYGVTTPIGQAFGLALHGLYDPASEAGLLTVGIVNAISSGLLLYAGLVQLVAEDFLTDQSYVDLVGRRRVEACVAVFAGAMLMSFVGAFA